MCLSVSAPRKKTTKSLAINAATSSNQFAEQMEETIKILASVLVKVTAKNTVKESVPLKEVVADVQEYSSQFAPRKELLMITFAISNVHKIDF